MSQRKGKSVSTASVVKYTDKIYNLKYVIIPPLSNETTWFESIARARVRVMRPNEEE
jgi:hypothetical protein